MKKIKSILAIGLIAISVGITSIAPVKVNAASLEYSFDVISDAHITADTNVNSNHLAVALQDIKNYSYKSKGVIFNGDSVDSYDWNAYSKLRDIVSKYGKGLPFKFFTMGNHELFDDSHASDYTTTPYSYKLNRFLYFADSVNRTSGNETSKYLSLYDDYDTTTVPYYKTKINNDTFVFLGSQSIDHRDKADLQNDQLTWLDDNTLYKVNKYEEHQPIFVFGHQGAYDTVAGTHPGQGWDGIYQYDALKFILNKYPNVFYFSGHTHWNLNVNGGYPNNIMYGGNPTYNSSVGAIFLANGGITEGWTPSYTNYNAATGLHVEVYSDNKVIIKTRDYMNHRYISQYTVDLNPRYRELDKVMKNM